MTVNELLPLISGTLVTAGGGDNAVQHGCCCDLLSWVMAKGSEGCAWVTVQTHLNVIAVASLHDMACVICPEDVEPEAASVAKAEEEGIAVVKSPLSAYRVCGIMYANGITE